MIRINLLPVRAARKKETLKQNMFFAAGVIVLLCAVLWYLDFDQQAKVRSVNDEIKRTEAEINRLKTVIGEVGKLKQRKKELEDKTRVIEQLVQNRSGPVRLMDELSAVIPQKAWIKTMAETGSSITLQAEAVNEETVSDFMLNMEKSPFFSDIKLTQITSSGTGSNAKKVFGLSARRLSPTPDQLRALDAERLRGTVGGGDSSGSLESEGSSSASETPAAGSK